MSHLQAERASYINLKFWLEFCGCVFWFRCVDTADRVDRTRTELPSVDAVDGVVTVDRVVAVDGVVTVDGVIIIIIIVNFTAI